ncbi:hypothetical protein DWU95_30460, partial [Burkholderia contaminans]
MRACPTRSRFRSWSRTRPRAAPHYPLPSSRGPRALPSPPRTSSTPRRTPPTIHARVPGLVLTTHTRPPATTH